MDRMVYAGASRRCERCDDEMQGVPISVSFSRPDGPKTVFLCSWYCLEDFAAGANNGEIDLDS